MNMRSTCSIGFALACTVVLLSSYASSEESTNHLSSSRTTPAMSAGTNLLYIVPKDSIGSNGWQSVWKQNKGDYSEGNDTEAHATTVYFIQNPNPSAKEDPFAALFGPDCVIVPADDSGNLFKLIAAKMPEEPAQLPTIRLDTHRYHLEETTAEPAWPKGSQPKSIMMKWAEWWQSETNATPVVLILVRF